MTDRIASDWLELREPADAAARDVAWPTLRPHVADWLAITTGPLHIIDVGAGTGANTRWLAPRLAELTDRSGGRVTAWTLLDHDDDLLRGVPPGTDARLVQGDVADLPDLLDDRGTLVTASALLDLLTAGQLDALLRDTRRRGAALLLALTIGNCCRIEPLTQEDAALSQRLDEAFHRHQARGEALGHGAIRHLQARRPDTLLAASPWRLGQQQAPLACRFLIDRVGASVEAAPDLGGPARDWLQRRCTALDRGELRITLEHLDAWISPDRSR